MKHLAKVLGLAMVCGALLSCAPAKAWYDSDGYWHHSRRWREPVREQVAGFSEGDRAYLTGFLKANGKYCPDQPIPRAKSCAPRPAVTSFYPPGTIMPKRVKYARLPSYVTTHLSEAPAGAIYVRSSDNVYLINRKNRTVIDAISLFESR
jgi:hypothetical protein